MGAPGANALIAGESRYKPTFWICVAFQFQSSFHIRSPKQEGNQKGLFHSNPNEYESYNCFYA